MTATEPVRRSGRAGPLRYPWGPPLLPLGRDTPLEPVLLEPLEGRDTALPVEPELPLDPPDGRAVAVPLLLPLEFGRCPL